ncbi:CRTISO [Symbiodinium natans]|uniref:CRTISO protein n=1 Tax=Symbiodinium natans TaxID=878477 RepID=A0A812H4U7_9DINO|nr:CRTISO [Symbiodinium natans]
MLARAGREVLVCESHSVPGGVAHSFSRNGYEFDSGPSLLSGCSTPVSANPLRLVLNALGEDCDWATYPGWRMVTPDGDFEFKVGDEAHWEDIVARFGTRKAVEEWRALMAITKPLGEISKSIPAAALRGDLGAVQTLQRFFPRLPALLLNGPKFQAPFSDLLRDAGVQDTFLKKWMDYICFVLQALPADTHPSAPVAYMISDMYEPGAFLDYPRGGMGALISALERGVTKHRGRIRYNAHVEEIVAARGKAKGVRLRSGERILAREAVISNASVWDTAKLLPEGTRWPMPKPVECGSFMHLHLGLNAKGLPNDMPLHYSVIRDWKEPIDATGNVVIISVPSVVNPSLAPAGRHCLHAYLAATEPYELWQGMKRGSSEYEAFKRERAAPLFEAVEKAVPGACENIELELIGSPLTHARFNRRHRGTYGPFMPSSAGMLPGPSTPVDGLLCCGDSTFPGIGVPAAVASGCAAANVLLSVEEHLEATLLEAPKNLREHFPIAFADPVVACWCAYARLCLRWGTAGPRR